MSPKPNNSALRDTLEQAKTKLFSTKKITIKIKVTAKSGKHEFSDLMADGTIKIKVKAARDQGKANAEVIELLADFFGVSRSSVTILTGETSAQKIIEINPN